MKLSFCSSKALKELANVIKKRRRSSSIDFLVEEMNFVVKELHNDLQSLPCQTVMLTQSIEYTADGNEEKIEKPNKASVLEVLPLGTLVTLLIESAERIEETVFAVNQLATKAEFKTHKKKKSEENQPTDKIETNSQGQEAMKTLEMV